MSQLPHLSGGTSLKQVVYPASQASPGGLSPGAHKGNQFDTTPTICCSPPAPRSHFPTNVSWAPFLDKLLALGPLSQSQLVRQHNQLLGQPKHSPVLFNSHINTRRSKEKLLYFFPVNFTLFFFFKDNIKLIYFKWLNYEGMTSYWGHRQF